MPTLTCEISQSLWTALQRKSEETGESVSHLVSRALADSLQVEHGTLFQVSTSGALVEGVFGGVVSVGTLREHGDFGLGTFIDLDGEMIVLDGEVYQMRSDGTIRIPDDREQVPFAIVTHFSPDATAALPPFASFKALTADLDARRGTDNLFFAALIRGRFARLHVRIACKADAHESLVEATGHQAEFTHTDIDGTLLGFWTPAFAKGFGIPGWHLHFISDDRKHGGHVLDCTAEGLTVALEHIDDFRVAIPETAAFLAADLSGDTTAALDKAERAH
ncbi:acetolactate decarboxylase [Segnochrobactrum spirostomi]|uniref:Alpha-acetolactate decarboxylase n=1 Tax=Segnochrobactrum spirostomi TaxID=2608987 RepID=A0A6A7Y4C1_9HYPH|nr:acetolactate decarboxylase [Segnochrobactrum spirostomi]MQT13980.1 acetolactate decarboxylase [Segnochrobactrum spirostomi]